MTTHEEQQALQADAEQTARAESATARGTTDPVRVADLLEGVERMRAAWGRRKLAVLESECPECAIDTQAALSCSFRGQEGVCKYTAEIARRGRAKILGLNLARGKVPKDLWAPILGGTVDASTAAVAAAKRIIAGEGQLAIISGGPGQGKSFGLALAIAERGGWFVHAASFDPFGKDVNELLQHCLEVPLLGLDDLAAGRSISDIARQRAEQILCSRWDAGLPTLATTNLQKEQFWPLYGGHLGRVADRLAADKVGWVRCLNDNRRSGGICG
jgi:hypothetical protein